MLPQAVSNLPANALTKLIHFEEALALAPGNVGPGGDIMVLDGQDAVSNN